MNDLRSPSPLAEPISERPVLAHVGSRYFYIFHRCRCAACTTANATYQRGYLRRRRLAGVTDKHGALLMKPEKPDSAFT